MARKRRCRLVYCNWTSHCLCSKSSKMAASLFLPIPPPAIVFRQKKKPHILSETTFGVVGIAVCPCPGTGREFELSRAGVCQEKVCACRGGRRGCISPLRSSSLTVDFSVVTAVISARIRREIGLYSAPCSPPGCDQSCAE